MVEVPISGAQHPTEVDAEWGTFILPSGAVILQISTFGSDARVSERKVSQTIQIDKVMAEFLSEALVKSFGLKPR